MAWAKRLDWERMSENLPKHAGRAPAANSKCGYRMLRGEVIAIGDELTTGQRLDTNSQWISERLTELGVAVVFHTTVADDLLANIEVFRAASQRADVVVSTGGLGPTADDLTREAMAAAAGVELVEDAASLEHIENLFRSRGRGMPDRNRLQAQFPRGAKPIPNPHGTAPGIEQVIGGCRIFALPGVPAEMFDNVAGERGAGDCGPARIAAGDSASADQMLRRGRKSARSDASGCHRARSRTAGGHHG